MVMRTLEEYSSIPTTPPPQDKDKGILNVENEISQEKIYLEALYKENKELEKISSNYDKELAYIKSSFPQNIEEGVIRADNELWFKYEAQRESNRKLEKEKKHLEAEIKQIEEQGVVNLDSLTQSELILYVKQLERNKTDLTSNLRRSEWGLDKQAKESHHFEQLRNSLEAEIRHYDEELAMFRHYNKTSCPSATSRSSQQLSGIRGSIKLSSVETTARKDVTPLPTAGFQRRNMKGGIPENRRIIDSKKGPINKRAIVGTLPSLRTTRNCPGTPEIVVTDTTGGKAGENRMEKKTNIPLELLSERNFENSPPPKTQAGFTFDEEVVKTPVAEVKPLIRTDRSRNLDEDQNDGASGIDEEDED